MSGQSPPEPDVPEPQRRFLFLQGPHGPFFARLAKALSKTGAQAIRVGFNAGDRMFWHDRASYLPFTGSAQDWPQTLRDLIRREKITDIVLYGDTRPRHARAIDIARQLGLAVHVFEEGYLRPYWVTYERGGSNGHSRLMQLDMDQIRGALESSGTQLAVPPDHWGEIYPHMVYGALYHWGVLFLNRRYRGFRRHRPQPLGEEALQYTRRLILRPWVAVQSSLTQRRIRRGGYPYHLALLQLDHDANFRKHSPFHSTPEFLARVIEGFANGAPAHHHLVIKAHPLETGRRPLHRIIRDLTVEHGLTGRVHYVRAGKLGALMDPARSVVTVNSTAGQQALWRSIPLRIFGEAVYGKPDFVSTQTIEAFFAHPHPPDHDAYRLFRRFLLETSQIPGGFYSRRGRRQLIRQVVDLMLHPDDPYDARFNKTGRGDLAIPEPKGRRGRIVTPGN